MKNIRRFESEVYANMAVTLLDDHGIKAVIYGADQSAVDGPMMSFGGIDVIVIDDDRAAEAEAVLNKAALR